MKWLQTTKIAGKTAKVRESKRISKFFSRIKKARTLLVVPRFFFLFFLSSLLPPLSLPCFTLFTVPRFANQIFFLPKSSQTTSHTSVFQRMSALLRRRRFFRKHINSQNLCPYFSSYLPLFFPFSLHFSPLDQTSDQTSGRGVSNSFSNSLKKTCTKGRIPEGKRKTPSVLSQHRDGHFLVALFVALFLALFLALDLRRYAVGWAAGCAAE